jgi:predicted amidohydrolase YtcJ
MSHPDSDSTILTRREFLVTAGVGLAAIATGCKANRRSTQVDQSVLYQAPLAPPPQGPPDFILRNGKVFTVDAGNTIAQALAVKDGFIQAVGANETIDALKAASTQVVELSGRVLTPGLIDAHIHVGYLDVLNQMIPFLPPEIKTVEDMMAKLKDVAAQTPEGQWIQVYFITNDQKRLPTRQEMDAVAPNNPVWMMQQGGHIGAANSLALQLASITAETPDPPGGIIERDKNGEPTGAFYNHRAMNVLRHAIPPRPEDTAYKSIREGQPVLLSHGVTSFQDVYVFGSNVIDAYMQLGKDGQMVIQGAIYPVLENPADAEYLLGLEHYKSDFMRLGGYKLQIDGSALTAYCHEATKGSRWDMPAWPEDIYKKAVKAFHDTGLQVCVHCVGDAAVDLTLDAFEEAMNANPRPDPRHRIEHCCLTKPETTQRIKDLGVVVSNTPAFIRMVGDFFVDVFGDNRYDRIIVEREWLEAGVPMALGSDYPSTPWIQPQMTMASAIARKTASQKTLNPEQCMTFEEALRAHTIGSAYAGFEEGLKGSLEPGKLADLAVWTQDPSAMDPRQLVDATIDMTYVRGKLLYSVSA